MIAPPLRDRPCGQRACDGHESRVGNGDGNDGERHEQHRHQATRDRGGRRHHQACQHRADEQTPGVTHEDGGWLKIIPQEGQHRARQGPSERRVPPRALMRERDTEEKCRDRAYAGGHSIHVV